MSTSATHQRAACSRIRIRARPRRMPTHKRQRKRRGRRKGVPAKAARPCQRRRGGEETRAKEAHEHLERAFILEHPDAHRRRGRYFRSFKFTRIKLEKPQKKKEKRVSPIYVRWWRSCRAGRGRRKAAVGPGRDGVLRNRAPASCSHSQIR